MNSLPQVRRPSDAGSKGMVIKIGGSALFSSAPLDDVIAGLRSDFPTDPLLFIVGGGELVESMRLLHHLRPELDCQKMHWRCIELLAVTTQLASELTPGIPLLRSWDDLQAAIKPPQTSPPLLHPIDPLVAWVQPSAFYSPAIELPPGVAPAHDWSTTSDSLAWLLAFRLGIERVLLLKSCSVEGIDSVEQAAVQGLVDPELPRLSTRTPEIQIQLRSIKTG